MRNKLGRHQFDLDPEQELLFVIIEQAFPKRKTFRLECKTGELLKINLESEKNIVENIIIYKDIIICRYVKEIFHNCGFFLLNLF